MGMARSKHRGRGERRSTPTPKPSGRARHKLQFAIGSDFATSCRVQKRIVDEVIRHGFNSPSIFAVRLALEEALANAIKHGNRLDSGKKVRVEAEVTPRQVRIVIEDEGGGFDRSRVPDPTIQANLEKTCGRGILLIEAYMDKVRWSRGGRRLEMIRRNADGPPVHG